MNHSFWIPKHICHDLFSFLVMPIHAGPPWLSTEVVHLHFVTGPCSLLENVALQFKLVQTFSGHRNMLYLLFEHLYLWDPLGTHTLSKQ
jgi:hypothetical protein